MLVLLLGILVGSCSEKKNDTFGDLDDDVSLCPFLVTDSMEDTHTHMFA